MKVTDKEKALFLSFWMNQREAIKDRVSRKTLHWFDIFTNSYNVGYNFGKLRPGKLGQWDLYWNLTGERSVGCDENETLIASGLTAMEVAEEKRREHYRENFVDHGDKLAIAMLERLQSMNSTELATEIIRMKKQFDEMKQVIA